MEEPGSGGVTVTSLSAATAALDNIDKAIETVSGFRASFGAVENRIDAKSITWQLCKPYKSCSIKDWGCRF